MERCALATCVAEIESQIGSVQDGPDDPGECNERDTLRRERAFAMAMVSGLTLFAVAVDGYHPYAEDGGLYMAGVKRLLGPALYPHATAFVLEPMRLSLFAPAVAGVVRASHLGLPTVLFALHLGSIWATLWAAWMLASRCWTRRLARAGAVVLLACWLALPVAGTALLLMDAYMTARSLSTPAMVLALVGAMEMTGRSGQSSQRSRRRGMLLWAGSIGFATAMHPLMAAYALGATLMLVCARASRRRVRVWGTATLAASAVILAACLQALASPESAATTRIAMTRSYWFIAAWRWYEWMGLAAPLAILAIFAMPAWGGSRQRARRELTQVEGARRALTQMAIAVGATACVVAMGFARVDSATHLVARMQPLRAFQVVYLVLVLMLGAQLGERVLRRSAGRWAAVMLLLGGVMWAADRMEFPDSSHLETPWSVPRNPWVQAFVWIRGHTPKDALFALDADYINAPREDAQCFRAIAERSALADYSKDGGETSIAPKLTAEWTREQAAQQGLSATWTSDAQRVAALGPLGVSWVVLQTGATTHFDCPYANAAVMVCRVR
jgi:type II secretory pathway pseudopilin PulG